MPAQLQGMPSTESMASHPAGDPRASAICDEVPQALRSTGDPAGCHKIPERSGFTGASVHSLRHIFATHHLAKGTSLPTIRDALGHSDLKTTSIYISTAKVAMRRDLQENAL